jgi:Stigma-specific protein, Stig1/Phosphoesterase family
MLRYWCWFPAVFFLVACDGQATVEPSDGGDAAAEAEACGVGVALCNGTCISVTIDDDNCGACGVVCSSGQHCAAAMCQASKIEHVILIVQENHTFDSYFGRYCQAPAGSSPTCTTGPSCCERAPDTEPMSVSHRSR